MDELNKRHEEELIEALSSIADETTLYDDWFVKGLSIGESFEEIFDVPHINWDNIAPNSKQSRYYSELYDLMSEIYGDKFRRSEFNNHISIDAVETSGIWKSVPKLARALREAVERELAAQKPPEAEE